VSAAQFIKPDDVQWKQVRYLKLPLSGMDEQVDWAYSFELPEPLASWDVFTNWEKERTLAMAKHLRKGMVLYDVGTEQGWLNLAYAKMVGPENMVLIEPTKVFWPNIKAIWKRNFDVEPLACIHALIGDKADATFVGGKGFGGLGDGDLIDRNSYTYLHDNAESSSITTVDALADAVGVPDAITIDIEGAELIALRGAENTLKKHHPIVFVSIHADLGAKDYGLKDGEVQEYLARFGYIGEHLGTDHESHWYFK